MRRHKSAKLKTYIIQRWPHKKEEVEYGMRPYWLMRNELAMIYGIAMKGKRIIIPFLLQKQIPWQSYSNHMGIEKMRFIVCESVY